MFAIYKGNKYKLVKDRRREKWELISKQEESIKDGFIKDGHLFYKPVSDLSELEDVLDISVFVEYETHLQDVPSVWKLQFSKEYFTEDSVKLVFGMGLLPGWHVDDKNVSSQYVKVDDISKAWMETKSKTTGIIIKEEIKPQMLCQVYMDIINL